MSNVNKDVGPDLTNANQPASTGYAAATVEGFDWNDVATSMWSFAARDEENTFLNGFWPCEIKQLGLNAGKYLADAQHQSSFVADATPARWNDFTIAGLCVLSVEPLLALSRNGSISYANETYQKLWSYFRLYDAAVGEFQPNDLSAMDYGNYLGRCYLAYWMKVVTVLNSVTRANNRYSQAKMLYRALGFTDDFDEAVNQLPNMVRKMNQSILAMNRLIKRLVNAFPGANRLPAILSKWFKDSPDEAEYVQAYTFRMPTFWMIQNDATNHTWQFVPEEMPTTFVEFTNKIADYFNYLCYDESSLQVQRYLNKVVEANENVVGDVVVSSIDLGNVPYPLPNELGYDYFNPEYNRDMLLAIHNATILSGVRVSAATQLADGTWTQTAEFENERADGFIAAGFSKPIDLPWRNASKADLINATTWTVIRHPEVAWDDFVLDAEVCGSEIITDAYIYGMQAANAGTSDEFLVRYRLRNAIEFAYQTETGRMTINDAIFGLIVRTLQFNYSPMMYTIIERSVAGHNGGFITDIVTPNLEVLYTANFQTLKAIKEQYLKNFWGYPFMLGPGVTPGQFETTALNGRTLGSASLAPAPSYGEYKEDRDMNAPANVYGKVAYGRGVKGSKRKPKYGKKDLKDRSKSEPPIGTGENT